MNVRDIMTEVPRVVDAGESVRRVAEFLDEHQIGCVVVCDEDRLQGLITDRDIAIQVVARGKDPASTTARDLLDPGNVVFIGVDDTLEAAMETMKRHAVRRLPVVDESRDLVGIISQGDLARHADAAAVGDLLEAISTAPDNTGRG